MGNYTIYHLHSDLSNGVTNIDSITKFEQYIDRAAECGMKALGFAEHGSVFKWLKKKEAIEKAGMKYLHAEEFYVTKGIEEKIRDNCHAVLIAKNYDGLLELNRLSSIAFNKDDGHKYYNPRITIDELVNTSDNIIVTTACLGGILVKADNDTRKKFLRFIKNNKHRCYFEIQHHNVDDQKRYNQYLYNLSKKYGIPLIAGTDTHALNAEHLEGRRMLQIRKGICFDNEEGWDLTFKTYDELVEAYKIQDSIPMDAVLEAIENTNRMADSVEEFEMDRSYKYPHLWGDNSEQVFRDKIKAGIIARGVDKYPNYQEYLDRIEVEMKAYIHNGAIDFMLLMEDIISWCKTQDIPVGYGRGSVNGSVIAWLVGITEMDSIKYDLNFERFMNVERVSLSDIDTDFPPSRIEEVKNYIFNKHGLYCCDIATFNTIALKGAIRDICGAFFKENLNVFPEDLRKRIVKFHDDNGNDTQLTPELAAEVDKYIIPHPEIPYDYMTISTVICDKAESDEDAARTDYPDVFKYVDLVQGVIVSVGNHPCGSIVSPITVDDRLGTYTTSTDDHVISQLYMKEVDSLNYVKLDLLKLDTIELIDQTCKLIGMPLVKPEDLPIDDVAVWNSMRDDTTGIFQWEGRTGNDYIKKLLSDDNIKKYQSVNENVDRMTLLSIGNSAIRPAGASYRDDLANGIVRKSGSKAIDDFLKPTFGYLVFQCQIISFLHEYCGFSMGAADVVRRHFAKKTGTDKDIPIIKDGGCLDGTTTHIPGFITTMKAKYGMEKEEAERTIVAFLQVIEDASNYLFSLNHSQPYSFMGFACGYLRYYHPVEFCTCALNINKGNEEKTKAVTNYAKSVGIKIANADFRHASAEYSCDVQNKIIYKGIESIKYLNASIAPKFNEFANKKYGSFTELLADIVENKICDSRQLDILIKLDFFAEFGKFRALLKEVEIFNKIYGKKQFSIDKLESLEIPEWIADKYAEKKTAKTIKIADSVGLCNEVIKNRYSSGDMPKTTVVDRIDAQNELLGYINITLPKLSEDYYYVVDIVGKSGNFLKMYQLSDGSMFQVKIRAKTKQKNPIDKGDVIKIEEISDERKWRKDTDGKWYQIDETEKILTRYSRVKTA